MRQINKIIVHCSDSDNPNHDNKETIYKWHVEERGFSDIGYHFLILDSGDIVKCRQLYKKGAHCFSQNSDSIGICLTGRYGFSDEQFSSLQELVSDLKRTFGELKTFGHRDFSDKTCPNFDVNDYI